MSLQLGEDVPWLARRPASYVSSFDVNITAFVKSHGRPVKLQGLPDVLCWTISLVGKREPLQLQIYKEKNGENGSELCDQCRIIGRLSMYATRYVKSFSSHTCSACA